MSLINLGSYPGRDCPNIHFKPTVIDRILEAVALLMLLVVWVSVYLLYTWKGGILSHNVWIMGGMALFCTVLLGICSYAPVRNINFPVRVNERNIGVQYLLAVRLIRILNVTLNLIFLSSIFGEYYKMARLFFYTGFGVLSLILIVYFVIAHKYK